MQNEIWKDVPNYEGKYQVSNLGNVKSLSRKQYNSRGFFISKERILKLNKDKDGYNYVNICCNSKATKCKIHQLVAIAFLNHKPCGLSVIVDHINNIKTDNRVENLQLIGQRQNASKDRKNKTSKYTGVCWYGITNKWLVTIYKNGKSKHLGYFTNEEDANQSYIKAKEGI